jgi:hypothetical protein
MPTKKKPTKKKPTKKKSAKQKPKSTRATAKKTRVAGRKVATRKPAKRKAAKQKVTKRKPRAVSPKPTLMLAATGPFAIAAVATIRDQVVSILARELNVGADDAGKKKVKDLVAACDVGIQSTLASAVNHHWTDLVRPFDPSDVSCADTASTLAEKVTNRLP